MSRVFITGSTDGLGYAAARVLIEDGHEVVLHARSRERATALADLAKKSLGIVLGDLSSAVDTRRIAEQVNAIGRMDAVIHNAGIYRVPSRSPTPEGHAKTLAVNTLAPYMLTALIERPKRLVYLSSGMHRGGRLMLNDIDWVKRRWDQTQAYSESKLYVTALALAVARLWPDVLSNAVDPRWVPTHMGGDAGGDPRGHGRGEGRRRGRLVRPELPRKTLGEPRRPAARPRAAAAHHGSRGRAGRQRGGPAKGARRPGAG